MIVILPLLSVDVIALPLMSKLSTIKWSIFEFEYNKKAKLNKSSCNLISGEPYAYHIGSYKKFLK